MSRFRNNLENFIQNKIHNKKMRYIFINTINPDENDIIMNQVPGQVR